MKTSTVIAVVAVVIVAVVAGIYFTIPGAEQGNTTPPTSSGMLAEENAIIILDQKPGTEITASLVQLAGPGYLVIHEASNGQPGATLGSSALLGVGENTNVSITLSRPMRDGEIFIAMLHAEADGNGAFDIATDPPIASRLGGPINAGFVVSADANVASPVSY